MYEMAHRAEHTATPYTNTDTAPPRPRLSVLLDRIRLRKPKYTPPPSTPGYSSASSASTSRSSLSLRIATPPPQPKSGKTSDNVVDVPGRSRKHKRSKAFGYGCLHISARSSSLFFPNAAIDAEQEAACTYRAQSAATLSCADLSGVERISWASSSNNNHGYSDYSALEPLDSFDTALRRPAYPYGSGRASQSAVSLLSHTQYPNVSAGTASRQRALRHSAYQHRMSVDVSARAERSEIWSSPIDMSDTLSMPPPPVPTRSALRAVASSSNLRQAVPKAGADSPPAAAYTLPVDPPTQGMLSPSLASFGLTEQNRIAPVSPPLAESSSTGFAFGRKKRTAVRAGSISGDPNRVRDGAIPRGAASGIYTPPTFYGSAGAVPAPQPSDVSSSRVYTPRTFSQPSPSLVQLPARPPPSPSRSTSVSSSTSTSSSNGEPLTPGTPHTPSSRLYGAVSGSWGSAMSGLKRASASLTQPRSASAPSPSASTYAYTPTSARDGYFPQTIQESSTTSTATWRAPLSPGTPGSTRQYGLGLGIHDAASPYTPQSGPWRHQQHYDPALAGAISATSERLAGIVLVGDVPKGKRKPVPQVADKREGEGESGVSNADSEHAQPVVGQAL